MPYERARDLPSFSEPPVNEVAIGIGFRPLRSWGSVAPGEFRSLVRERYPKVEDKGPLPPMVAPTEIGLSFGVLDMPPVRRTWFLTDTEETLIQIQEDRLHVNWRRVREEDAYPRYGHVLTEVYICPCATPPLRSREGRRTACSGRRGHLCKSRSRGCTPGRI
jgi:hypothetical protein